MYFRHRYLRLREHRPVLALACVLTLSGAEACAQSVSTHEFGTEAHGAHCRCGTRCKQASCCCGRASRSDPSPASHAPGPKPEQPVTSSGPCLEEAPCGEPGLPGSPTTCQIGRAS